MSRRWNSMSEAERAELCRRFALALAADELAAPDPPAGTRPPRFDELYAAALDPVSALDASLSGRLTADAAARAAFEAALRDNALCWFPVAAAAAGGGSADDVREEDGFRVWIRPSSAGDGQVYVLVRAAEGRAGKPAALVALPPDGPPASVVLPEDIDGVYQVIAREESALVRAIRDPAAKLALR